MGSSPETASELERLAACYSTWGRSYFDEYYGPGASYPPVHMALLRSWLASRRPRHLLDAGCGPASCLRLLVDLVPECWGFDLTPEMIDEGRRVMESLGRPADRLTIGSVLDAVSFRPAHAPTEGFDAITCVGVMTHVPERDEPTALHNIFGALAPDGVAAIEARNALFALFTMNRYTRDLLRDRIIRPQDAATADERALLERASEMVAGTLRVDLPPIRRGKVDEPGYDEVQSRTHIPFELVDAMRRVGFVDVTCRFCHFHAFPPMAASLDPDAFKRMSLALETQSDDWRGHFMASQFVVFGRRP